MENHSYGIDGTFDALSDPTRRAIVELLVQKPHRASELAVATGTSRSRMSKHLRILLDAGLARDERLPDDARARVFYMRPEGISDVREWLARLQKEWDAQLRSFKEHVEKKGDA